MSILSTLSPSQKKKIMELTLEAQVIMAEYRGLKKELRDKVHENFKDRREVHNGVYYFLNSWHFHVPCDINSLVSKSNIRGRLLYAVDPDNQPNPTKINRMLMILATQKLRNKDFDMPKIVEGQYFVLDFTVNEGKFIVEKNF